MGPCPLHGWETVHNDRIWSIEAPGTSAKILTQWWFGAESALAVRPPSFPWIEGWKSTCDTLEAVVLPWAQQLFIDANWTVHKAKITQDPFCRLHLAGGMAALLGRPQSGYTMWSILEVRACVKLYKILEVLKQSLRREWDRYSPTDLRPIADNFKSRLELCIQNFIWSDYHKRKYKYCSRSDKESFPQIFCNEKALPKMGEQLVSFGTKSNLYDCFFGILLQPNNIFTPDKRYVTITLCM